MKIQIVSCCLEEGNLSFPLGALSIQTAIEHHPTLKHFHCTLAAYTLEDDPILAAKRSAESEATHIGCSVYLWNRKWFDQFAQHLKKLAPSVTLFAGGTEVTANPRSFDLEIYDFLTLGEGEQSTTLALSQLLEDKRAPRTRYSDQGKRTHLCLPPGPAYPRLGIPFRYSHGLCQTRILNPVGDDQRLSFQLCILL